MQGEASTIRAVVRAVDADGVHVEVAQGGCGRCHEKGGCGGQHLTQAFCSGPRRYYVANDIGVQVGDQVTVEVAAGSLRRGANLAYGMPLLGLIGGALTGKALAGDAGAIIGGGLGLVLAYWLLARKSRNSPVDRQTQPRIVARHAPASEAAPR